MAAPSARREASNVSPVSAKPTVSPASEKTRGTTRERAALTSVSRPSFRAIVRYWWSCRPRRRFASRIVPIGPATPRSSSGCSTSWPG